MANKRVYDAQGTTFNTNALGGVTQITGDAGYENVLEHQPDGLEGAGVVDRVAIYHRGSISSEDVTKFIALLASTASALTFSGRESGAATYGLATLDDPVPVGGSLTVSKSGPRVQYAGMAVNFELLHAAADDFDDAMVWLAAQAAPAYTEAARLIDPIAATHGVAGAILHPTSLSLNVTPTNILREFGDADIGITAIDVPGYRISGSLGFQDHTQQTGPPTHELAMALLKAAVGDLVVTVRASAGGTNQTITLGNCNFTKDAGRRNVNGYWEHVVDFALNWLDADDTVRTLGGAEPLVVIANV